MVHNSTQSFTIEHYVFRIEKKHLPVKLRIKLMDNGYIEYYIQVISYIFVML